MAVRANKMLDFSVNGAEQMSKLLDDFPKRLRRDIINATVARGATVFKQRAKANLKANGSVRTGTLLDSIRTRKRRKTHGIYDIRIMGAPHWHLVEFGTGPRKLKEPTPVQIKPGKWVVLSHTGAMPARPFLRPVFDEDKVLILREMVKRMGKRMGAEAEKMSQEYGTMSKTFRKKLAK